jgi:signal peptidase I
MNKTNITRTVLKEIGFLLLSEGKTLKVKAEGLSMYPVIKPGSIIYIEPFNSDSPPVPGEIVAWKREMTFVVHRLVRIVIKNNLSYFITRGDSCAYEDQPVTADQLAGRVIRVETQRGLLKDGKQLNRKSKYLFNRLLVWIYFKAKLLKRLFKFRNERKNTSIQGIP